MTIVYNPFTDNLDYKGGSSSGSVTDVLGTPNRITSTGGTTPQIDIASNYVGQTSLTTLGIVTTGTWNATVIGLAFGGTNANLTASNGGIFYSTATAGAILAGTATSGQILRSGSSSAPSWSTTTYPSTNAVNTLLYASSANVMSALATANNAILNTDSSGVPSLTTSPSISGTYTTTAGNFALPSTSSTAGQVTINGINYLHGFGSINTFVGPSSGNFTLSGSENTGCGSNTLKSLTSGSLNCGIGGRCLENIQTGNSNTAMGVAAMQNATSSNSCAFGQQSLQNNTSTLNCSFGYTSMTGSGAGTQNSCFGAASGAIITSGSFNSCFGVNSGLNLLTGDYNLLLGQNAGANYNGAETRNICLDNLGVTGESNYIRIGSVGTHTACSIAGIFGVTVAASSAVLIDANGVLGTILSSERYKENIEDVKDSILDLRPVKFRYKSTQEQSYGFIAEEVEKIAPQLCIYNKNHELESIKYHEFTALLLNEIKKLNDRLNTLERKAA